MKLKHVLVLALLALFFLVYKAFSCEFLVCARQDVDGIYGYVVDVKDDHAVWGTSECLPQFYLIICREMTVDEGRKYMQHIDDKDNTQGVSFWLKEDLVAKENMDTIKKDGMIYFLKEGIEQAFAIKEETITTVK